MPQGVSLGSPFCFVAGENDMTLTLMGMGDVQPGGIASDPGVFRQLVEHYHDVHPDATHAMKADALHDFLANHPAWAADHPRLLEAARDAGGMGGLGAAPALVTFSDGFGLWLNSPGQALSDLPQAFANLSSPAALGVILFPLLVGGAIWYFTKK